MAIERRELIDVELLNSNKIYNCSCCGKMYSVKEKLQLHLIMKHSLLTFKCPRKNCVKTFLQEQYLKKHLLVDHTLKIQKSYKCKETQKCINKGISFESQRKLNQHLKIHGEKKFKCSQCEKAFAIKYYLKSHMRKHSGVKQYNCRKCTKSFSSFSSRKYHEEHLH
jgi:uncharacterized Zn-finger protein